MAAEIKKGPLLGQRHLQTLLLFLAVVINTYSQLNASVAVVAMTNASTTNPYYPEYNWTEMEKSLIISSFFWGYFLTQFPGGYMCRSCGAKAIILISTLGSTAFALILPISVDSGGWQAYCGIRFGQGLFQGLLLPSVHVHLASWCPPCERNRLGALANMGTEFGTVLAMFLSGTIAASFMGWPGISYTAAAMGLMWCVLWKIFSANSPNKSKFILQAEKSYIEESKNSSNPHSVSLTSKPLPIPWRAIFTSGPFLASLVAVACQSWGFFTLQAEIPAYMNGIFDMDIKENTLFSTLPYLVMFCMSYVYLISSDVLLNYNILSLNALRKICNTLAFWLPAAGLIILGFLGEEQKTLAMVVITLSVGLNAGNTIGCTLSTADLSPNHAGILMGILNTFANFIPILTPLFAGFILTDDTNRVEWRIIFLTAALFFTVGNLVFIIFGSTNVQPWDGEHFFVSRSPQKHDKSSEGRVDFREII